MVLRRSHLPLQHLPVAVNYGWEADDSGSLIPIMTDDLPAPLALIELGSCNCKTECSTNRCKCRKNNFSCTDMPCTTRIVVMTCILMKPTRMMAMAMIMMANIMTVQMTLITKYSSV